MCAAIGSAIALNAHGRAGRLDAGLIVYLHVPATWMAFGLFAALAACALLALRTGSVASAVLAESLAPTGALFAFLTLWSGSLWGKPVWGTWWNWDGRVMADVVLLAVYLAVFAVHAAVEENARADRLSGLFALGGAVAVAMILAAAALGSASHRDDSPAAGGSVAALGLAAFAAALAFYSAGVVTMRARCVLLEREMHDPRNTPVERCV